MRNKLKIIVVLSFLVFSLLQIVFLSTGNIVVKGSSDCLPPLGTPAACTKACKTQEDSNCYEPDFQCINAKILNPSLACCNNKCRGSASSVSEPETFTKFEVFGTRFYVQSNRKLVALINVVITTILGGASLYALGRGIYLGAVKRANTDNPEEIQAIYNEIIKAIIPGFILLWMVIIIVQVVFSALGLGSLNQLVILGDPDPGTVITIT